MNSETPAAISTFQCLYCWQEKPTSEASLEHGVPQFLGGAFAPPNFHLSNVCRTCNSRLGRWVDASYGKSWLVTNHLAMASQSLYTSLKSTPIPLVCMGPVEIPGLVAAKGSIAEFWLGPYGSQVVWVRQNDEDMYWYAGGDPVGAKSEPSIAYFIPNDPNLTKFRMGVASFLAHFKKKKKKVRRILIAHFEDQQEGFVYPGFDAPLAEDKTNLEHIFKILEAPIQVRMAFYAAFDHRFIAKMALAIGYSLFGPAYLQTPHAVEAKRSLWPQPEHPDQLRGSSTFGSKLPTEVAQFLGYPSAVAITIMKLGHEDYVMAVSIDQKLPFSVVLAPSELNSVRVDPDLGYALLLFPSLKKSVVMTQVDLMRHNVGDVLHPELLEIETIRRAAAEFHAGLTANPSTPPSLGSKDEG